MIKMGCIFSMEMVLFSLFISFSFNSLKCFILSKKKPNLGESWAYKNKNLFMENQIIITLFQCSMN